MTSHHLSLLPHICVFVTCSTSCFLFDTPMDPWNLCMYVCMYFPSQSIYFLYSSTLVIFLILWDFSLPLVISDGILVVIIIIIFKIKVIFLCSLVWCCFNRHFISNGVLKAHQRTHEGVKSYKCPECSNMFSTNGSLKRHMGTHSDLRPFMCPYCHKTFKTSVNCRKHIKTHKHELALQVGKTVFCQTNNMIQAFLQHFYNALLN